MSESSLNSLSHPGKLRKTKQTLCGPDCKLLDSLGTVSLTLTSNEKSCAQQICIIRNLRNNLLGLPELQMLVQIYVMEKTIPDQLLTGLSNMHERRLKPDANPIPCLHPDTYVFL